jgi:hypothetical protein
MCLCWATKAEQALDARNLIQDAKPEAVRLLQGEICDHRLNLDSTRTIVFVSSPWKAPHPNLSEKILRCRDSDSWSNISYEFCSQKLESRL